MNPHEQEPSLASTADQLVEGDTEIDFHAP